MCSETFLRLPEEKKDRFLEAAWAEFTRVRFADTSINQIVRRCGIARGSFYQYFKDKEDLLRYMLESGWDYLTAGYYSVLREVEGDIFAMHILCFDRFLAQCGEGADPTLEHLLQFLRMNPGFDMQKIVSVPPACPLFVGCWPDIDTERLRRSDREYAFEVFSLCLMVLVHAVVESIIHPETAEECRRGLISRLEIIRLGSGAQ